MGGRRHRLKALSAAPCRVLTQRPAVRGSWRSRVPRPTRLWAVSASPGPAPGCVGLRRGLGRCPPRSSFTSKPEGTRPWCAGSVPCQPRVAEQLSPASRCQRTPVLLQPPSDLNFCIRLNSVSPKKKRKKAFCKSDESG